MIKDLNVDMFLKLSDLCTSLARKLNSWKLTKLSALSEVMEKELFIGSAIALRKEMGLVDNQLKKRLEDKGYKNVEGLKFNEVFEIPVRLQKYKKCVRGTIPKKILSKIGIPDKDLLEGTFIQLKIVGIKNNGTK